MITIFQLCFEVWNLYLASNGIPSKYNVKIFQTADTTISSWLAPFLKKLLYQICWSSVAKYIFMASQMHIAKLFRCYGSVWLSAVGNLITMTTTIYHEIILSYIVFSFSIIYVRSNYYCYIRKLVNPSISFYGWWTMVKPSYKWWKKIEFNEFVSPLM